MKTFLLKSSFVLLLPLLFLGCQSKNSVPTNNSQTDSTSIPTSTQQDLTQNWANYSSQDRAYSAKFPGQPQEQTQTQPSELGNLTFVLVLYEDKVNKRAYLTNHIKYPIDPKQYDAEKGLNLAREGALTATKSKLITENNISKNNFPGKEIISQTPEGYTQKQQFFIDPNGPTLYQVILVTEDGNIDFPEANAFFDSFVINQ